MIRNRLYIFIFVFCIVGYIWLAYLLYHDFAGYDTSTLYNACLFRNVTGLPCPSCGMSRSVVSVIQARFTEALWWHPLGFVMFGAMIVFPPWISYDWITNKSTYLHFYHSVESLFRNKWITISFILFMLTIWVWNIIKFT